MAWTAPSTFVAGAILTAAQLNTNVRDNSLAGGPIYATEALRDAAITSPFEGQRAYITGSTIAAATGSSTFVPTGIQTIYNGTKWVCITPVGTYQSANGTTSSSTYTTTLASGGTNPTVTLETGATALVSISASCQLVSGGTIYLSVSGTGLAASDVCFVYPAAFSTDLMLASTFMVACTAGTNTFSMNYKSGASVSASFKYRFLTVQSIA